MMHLFRRRSMTVLGALALCLGLAGGLALYHADGLWPSNRVRKARSLVAAWRLQEAEALLERHVARQKDDLAAARLYGEVLLKRGVLRKARNVLSYLSVADTAYRDRALYQLGFTHYYLGHLDTAQTLADDLAQWERHRGQPLMLGRALHLQGRIAFNRAAYDTALALQRRSLTLARQAASEQLEADVLRQIGVLYWYRARYDSALTSFYEPALALYRKLDDPLGEATTLSNIGFLYQHWGDWATAVRYQLQAFALRSRIGDQVGLADSYYFLGTQMPHWTSSERAGSNFGLAYVRKSLELSDRIGYAWGKAVAATVLHPTALEAAGLTEVTDRLGDAVRLLPEGHRLAYELQMQAQQAYRDGDLERSAALWRRQIEVRDSLQDNKKAYLLHLKYGQVLTQLGRFGEAEDVITSALERFESGHTDLRVELAEVYLRTGRLRQAEALLRSGVQAYDSLYIQEMRQGISGGAFENAAVRVYGARKTAYSRLIETLARQQDPRVFEYVERERALPFWGERDGETERDGAAAHDAFDRFVRLLEDYEGHPARFDDAQALLLAAGEVYQAALVQQALAGALLEEAMPEAASLADVQEVMQPDEVLLSFFIPALPSARVGTFIPARRNTSMSAPPRRATAQPVLVVVARRDTAAVVTLQAPAGTLESVVDVFRRALRLGASKLDDDTWHGPAHHLYRLLIAPLEAQGWLRPGDRVVVSPHGLLHLVPFQALTRTPRGTVPRFLLEDYVLSYVSTASLLTGRRRAPLPPMRSLLAVAPQGKTLAHTEQEVETIPDDLFSYTERLTNGAATADAVRQRLGQFDVVHLAAHARVNRHFPLYSYLALADRRLALHELFGQALKARLIVLSACESGWSVGAFGDVPSSEDRVSFPRAFLAAGASAVVATHWLAEDEATAGLMARFYRELASSCVPGHRRRYARYSTGAPACDLTGALVRAQRQALAEARWTGEKAHPFYWAGFHLTGDGR